MIVTFEGVQGSGMTLSGVAIAYEWGKIIGKPVASDSQFGFSSYRYLDAEEFVRECKRVMELGEK